jgi:putative pyruvate formate lyase activating enzyme
LKEGVDVEPEQIAAMMLQLSGRGCHNINFVTPTHVVPQLLEALILAVEQGLKIPLVYNSGGYDKVETLQLLDGIFDIYMPDFKFWDGKWAERYCEAPDYPDVATAALKEMHRQVGDLMIDDKGLAVRGLLVRHLVMPDNIAGSEKVFEFLVNEVSPNTYVNHINRRLSSQEFRDATDTARKAGLTRLDPRDRIRLVFGL